MPANRSLSRQMGNDPWTAKNRPANATAHIALSQSGCFGHSPGRRIWLIGTSTAATDASTSTARRMAGDTYTAANLVARGRADKSGTPPRRGLCPRILGLPRRSGSGRNPGAQPPAWGRSGNPLPLTTLSHPSESPRGYDPRRMRRAVYAGSFDPITLGHLWMVEHGGELFDELIVAIGINPDKRYLFSLADQLAMLRETTAAFRNVRVASYENMFLVHYARQVGASWILRGVRNEQDYAYERGMRYVNAELDNDVRTVLMVPPRELVEVSSSFVKGLVGPAGWERVLPKYVPEPVYKRFLAAREHHG